MKRIGLLPESELDNPRTHWSERERDLALNDYFNGANPHLLGVKYKSSRGAFTKTVLDKMRMNYADPRRPNVQPWCEKYEPTRWRENREGKRWTKNEDDLLLHHAQIGVAKEVTSKMLQRSQGEMNDRYVSLVDT